MGDRDRCVNIPGTPAPRTSPTWSSASLSARWSSSSITAARRAARSAASRVRATTPWAKPCSRFTALLEAVVIDRPNGAAESTDARIQRIKRMACGHRNRERLRDVINLRLAGVELRPRPVSALTISRSAAILLSEKCSTESDISRVGRTTRDPTPTVLVAARSARTLTVCATATSPATPPVSLHPARLRRGPRRRCRHGRVPLRAPRRGELPEVRQVVCGRRRRGRSPVRDSPLEAVVIDRPDGAAESTNARIQRIKRMACGHRNRERLRDVINLRLAGVELRPRPVSALTISRSAAILLSEKCSTESDISRVG
jgi:hypothetical protein